MKFIWKLILIISIAILYIGYAHPDWIVDPAAAISVSDKYDGDCQPNDDAGRCADKCLNEAATCLSQIQPPIITQPVVDNQASIPNFGGK